AAANAKAAALLARLTDGRRRRADLLLAPKPADPATRKQRDDDLEGYAREIGGLDRALRALLPAVGRAEQLAQATPGALRQALPADAAVVDFLRYTLYERAPKISSRDGVKGTARYLAFVITRDRIAWADLGPAARSRRRSPPGGRRS